MQELELNKDLYFRILDYATAKGYAPNTLKMYSYYLKRIIKKNPVLNRDVVRKILKKIKHQNERAVLVLINDYCYYSNVDFSIVIPKMKTKPRPLPKILSLGEVKVMVKSAPRPYDLMVRCIYNSGLRISEGIKLSWNHINWIVWLKEKKYGIATIKEAKGGKDRKTRIPPKLMKDLYNYAKELNILNEFKVPTGGMMFKCGLSDFKPDLLVTNRKKWKEEALTHAYDWFRYNIVKKHCEKALGHKINVHQLRHRFATYLYENGVPIERIQLLLGHADIRTTLIYTKVSLKDTFEMIEDKGEL